jgi:WD40 repeat protein
MRFFHALACVLIVPLPFGFGGDQPATIKDNYGDPLPPGVIARLGTLKLHAADGKAALSRDGKTIVTSDGRRVKYWDAADGKLREQRDLPVGPLRSGPGERIYLSADGCMLAIRVQEIGTPLDIWDIASAKRLDRLFLPETESLDFAVFSPDRKSIALVSGGMAPKRGIVRLWDIGMTSEGHRHVS